MKEWFKKTFSFLFKKKDDLQLKRDLVEKRLKEIAEEMKSKPEKSTSVSTNKYDKVPVVINGEKYVEPSEVKSTEPKKRGRKPGTTNKSKVNEGKTKSNVKEPSNTPRPKVESAPQPQMPKKKSPPKKK